MLGCEFTEDELHELYVWVDSIPLSRPKKSITRDFADGVLVAEVVHHYFPRLVELHNYSPAHNSMQKMYNWTTLNTKVFKRMGFQVPKEQYEAVVNCDPGAVERVLRLVKAKMAKFQENGGPARASSRQAATGAAAANAADRYSQQQQLVQLPDSPASYVNGNAVAGAMAALQLQQSGSSCSKLASSNGGGGGFVVTAAAGYTASDQVLRASLADKEQQLAELRETNEILETKIRKLEQLVRLKDAKIQALLAKMEAAAQAQQA